MDDDGIEEIIKVNSYTVRQNDGTIAVIEGDEETSRIAKEAIMNVAKNAAAVEVAEMFESLQDEMLELTTKVEQLEEQRANLYEQLDEYLHYMTEQLDEEWSEALSALNESNEVTLGLVDALATFANISPAELVSRVSALARSRAINPYGPNPDYGNLVPDSAHSKALASVKAARQPTSSLGDSGGFNKRVNEEMDSSVARYVDYLNGGYRGGLLAGRTKLAVRKQPEMPQQLAEELREEALDVISEVTDGMSETAVAELIEEAGEIPFDGNTEQLTEDLERKKAEKLAHDKKMELFNRVAWAQQKGMMFR